MDRTWIVVCDASHCRFFMKRNGTAEWVMFEEFEHPAGRAKGMDLVTDRPGRQMQSPGPDKRGATESRTSAHAAEVQRFARYIVDTLDNARRQNAFDNFVVVAPPSFLGELRTAMDDQLQKKVYATLAKDYTMFDTDQLQERISLP